jgi:hypothetical protein
VAKVKTLLNTSSLSFLGNKANLAPAPLDVGFISKALYQEPTLNNGGVPDARSVNAESKTTSYPRWFRAQA